MSMEKVLKAVAFTLSGALVAAILLTPRPDPSESFEPTYSSERGVYWVLMLSKVGEQHGYPIGVYDHSPDCEQNVIKYDRELSPSPETWWHCKGVIMLERDDL